MRVRTNLATLLILAATSLAALPTDASDSEPILIRNPVRFGTSHVSTERTRIGVPDDYKPCIALLKNGDLLVVAFRQRPLAEKQIREEMILFRSTDGGHTFSGGTSPPLLGREPYFSVTAAGTIFVTVHLLKQDVRNKLGYVHSYVHRSTDHGRTWQTTPILAEDVPGSAANAWTHTSRNVLELADGSLMFGVSTPGGHDYLWRSTDNGQTWQTKTPSRFPSVDTSKLWWPFHAETVFRKTRSGDLLAIARVDPRIFKALPGTELPKQTSDQVERMMVFKSSDTGATWSFVENLGSYGEMYPHVLRLNDQRLLLTFTVRALNPPLGVQAVLGSEEENRFVFNFDEDRFVIDAKTPVGRSSGGGFGPTVQLSDGTLVTALSFRGDDNKTRLEVVRWKLPPSTTKP
jgi:hypothetical protein